MKKTNRLASLFLALLLAFSCMAVPAMAAGDEGIMPQQLMGTCPSCHRGSYIYERGSGSNREMKIVCMYNCGYDTGWVKVG